MNGIIDIGNTSVKWAVFDGELLIESGRMPYGEWKSVQKAHARYKPDNWFMSSVQTLPVTNELGFEYEVFDLNTALPVTIRYTTPSTLGKDRIAAICGARHVFPASACLVIDAGSCITFDIMDEKGNYFGGSISPGIEMRLKAMHTYTEKLPLLSWEEPDGFIGDTTRSSMLQGVKQGVLGETLYQISLYEEKFPGLQVLITGGDASFFEKNLKKGIFAAPNLVLIGLNTILQYKQSLNA
ncbi:MAG TPA: pantothenate kinase [Bacteroidetes bacterium]|nr:pantothenate kinase [Bacteroidota bacterium]